MLSVSDILNISALFGKGDDQKKGRMNHGKDSCCNYGWWTGQADGCFVPHKAEARVTLCREIQGH
jgi:hypothetical protein